MRASLPVFLCLATLGACAALPAAPAATGTPVSAVGSPGARASNNVTPPATALVGPPLQVTTFPSGSSGLLNIALDARGQLYSIDTAGISLLTPDGKSTLRFPNATTSFADTPINQLLLPNAATFTSDGTLYALAGGNRLVRIRPDGTSAGFPAPASFDLIHPGLAIDSHGNAYFSANNVEFISAAQGPGDSYIGRIAPDGTLTAFAGKPGTGAGYQDGPAGTARFNQPGALSFDADDNLYVADIGNLSIRRITPAGVVSTVLGKGAPALPASPMPGLPSPDLSPLYQGTVAIQSLAVASDGTLYYSCYDNRIHRISPAGEESVYAGDGRSPCVQVMVELAFHVLQATDPTCHTDGPAASAEFNGPGTVLVGADATVYVLDGVNSAPTRYLREISPAGPIGASHAGPLLVTSQLASPPVPPSAPSPVPTPPFLAPSCNPSAGCPTLHGHVYDQAGQLATGTQALFLAPSDHPELVQQVGTVVAGSYAFVLAGSPAASLVLTVRGDGVGDRSRPVFGGRAIYSASNAYGGSPDPADPNELDFGGPANSADPDAPAFYLPAVGIQGTFTPARVVLPFEASHVTTIARDPGGQTLWSAGGLARLADGRIVTTNRDNNSVILVGVDGALSTLAGGPYAMPYDNEQYLLDGKGPAAHFYGPMGVAADAQGTLYVADSGNSVVRKVTLDGTVTTLAGRRPYGYADGQGSQALFSGVNALAVDASGNVFVPDIGDNCIRKITPDGTVTTFAGSTTPGFVNAVGAAARFRGPAALAVDAHGVLFVVDSGNHRIRRVTPDGAVSDVYGDPKDNADGTVTMPDLDTFSSIAVDASDNLYVAASSRVYKLTPAGVVTILAGYGLSGNADGAAAAAYFSDIGGLTATTDGSVYLTDVSNGSIRKITPD